MKALRKTIGNFSGITKFCLSLGLGLGIIVANAFIIYLIWLVWTRFYTQSDGIVFAGLLWMCLVGIEKVITNVFKAVILPAYRIHLAVQEKRRG